MYSTGTWGRHAAMIATGISIATLAACGDVPVGVPAGASAKPPVAPPPAAPEPAVASLRLSPTSHAPFFIGETGWVQVTAVDTRGSPLDTDGARAVSTDSSVVHVLHTVTAIRSPNPQAGRAYRMLEVALRFGRPGRAVLRVTLGGVEDSVVYFVEPLPPLSTTLVAESFSVLEYRVMCAWDCPYIAYAPMLRLRNPSPASPVEVVGVQFDLPGTSTGLCRGSVQLRPGQSLEMNGIDPYPWSNDLLFVSLNGARVPDGPVAAQAIVRDSGGAYSRVEFSGVIEREVKNPPYSQNAGYFSCPW